MRLLSWLISLPIFAALLVFALQNREPVTLSFWPFDATATMPLSLYSLGLLIAGFLGGLLVTIFLNIGVFIEKRRLTKEVAALGAKVKEQETRANAPVSGPTILSQGRYQIVQPKKNEPAPKRGWFGRIKK